MSAPRLTPAALIAEVRRLQRREELFLRFVAAYQGLWGGDVLAGLLADIGEEIGEEWRACTPDARGEI
ncbi:MAG TPA: hypothetical protein VFS44_02295 [Gemmatimonadaceae bacterium]|nr:hypothetical protein [Gemmatimonadaceae bacterium]